MKILVITQYFFPETFRVNTLCAELVARGHDVMVLTGYPQYPHGEIYEGYGFDTPYEKSWKGVRIERIKMKPRGKTSIGLLLNCWSFVYQGNKWVKKCEERFDVIYVFEVSPVTVGLPAVKYKEKFGTPLFFNVQDLWPENVQVVLGINNKLLIRSINRIVDRIYNASDLILCSSNAFVENIANRGVSRDKLVFWPQFCSEPDVSILLKPDIYTSDNLNIVFAGNIGDAQGLDLLIDVAVKLKDTKLRWFLVGDGRAKVRLRRRARDAGLDDIVFFIDRVSEDEANRYIYYADYAYLSFKANLLFDMTIPAKLQSYMACGTPILAAVGGESARIIREANCGIISEQSASGLVTAIQTHMLDIDSSKEYRENAYKYYDKHFRVDLLLDELEKLFIVHF